ncbi:hypothetical protein [Clostridium estertheticum]|nr:hypothetical protein [Clostridium estertheticum]
MVTNIFNLITELFSKNKVEIVSSIALAVEKKKNLNKEVKW